MKKLHRKKYLSIFLTLIMVLQVLSPAIASAQAQSLGTMIQNLSDYKEDENYLDIQVS